MIATGECLNNLYTLCKENLPQPGDPQHQDDIGPHSRCQELIKQEFPAGLARVPLHTVYSMGNQSVACLHLILVCLLFEDQNHSFQYD